MTVQPAEVRGPATPTRTSSHGQISAALHPGYQRRVSPFNRLQLWLISLSSLIFLLMIPPFHVPDEQGHFYRSYAIATGVLFPARIGDSVGSELPSSLPQTAETFLKNNRPGEAPAFKADRASYARELARPLDQDRREFVAYADAALIGPIAYAPQALGIAAGIALGASPLELLYLGRLTNMLVGLAVIWFAMRQLGVGRAVAGCFLMFPMVQAQVASLSPDATLIALGFLLIALLAQPAPDPGRKIRFWLAFTIVGSLLVSIKGVYIGLVAFGAILFWYQARRFGQSSWGLKAAVLALVIVFAVSLGWGMLIEHLVVSTRFDGANVDPKLQVLFMLSSPLAFLKVLATTMKWNWLFYVQSTVGILGWLAVPIGTAAYLAAAAAVCLAFLKGSYPISFPPTWIKLLAVATFLATGALIIVALYVRWTPVGFKVVDGVQGRYFLPVIFVFVLLQRQSLLPSRFHRLHNAAIIALSGFSILAAQFAVLDAFY